MLWKLYISGALSLMTIPADNTPIQSATMAHPEIAFVSDTQAPLWIERVMLKAHHNRQGTRLLFDDIYNRKPAALFLLGDVVSWGSSDRAWRGVRKYLDECREQGIRLYATLGNHELMGIRGMRTKAQKTFQQQFPEYRKTGFLEVIDSVAVILLNSNFGSLSRKEDSVQQKWFTETLVQLDADPSVQYVIAGCHHSPFTNSRIVGPNKAVQQKFVAPFLQAKKTALFLSGHAHAFEHFIKEGKHFMVIGGGGGVHQPLRASTAAMPDLASDYKPRYHYLTVKRDSSHLYITSHRLTDDLKKVVGGVRLEIAGSN